VLAVGRNLAGQTWYLMVATLGVLVMFVLAGGLRELPRIRQRDAGTPELVLGLLVATGGALLVVSALSFRDLERADMLIYGRYVEVVVPPLLAIALAKLSAERLRGRLGVLLAVMTVATAVVVALRLGVHPPRAPNRWNVASLPFFTLSLGPASVLGAGAVATAATAALAVLVRRVPRTLAPVLLALFIPTTAVGEHNPVLSGQRSVYPNAWISPERSVAGARKIAYDLDHYDVFGRYAYQWFLPHSRLVLFSSTKGSPPAEYVITSHAWPARDRRLRAERVWDDPGRDQAIFRVVRVP
jgi:hypothetical protein